MKSKFITFLLCISISLIGCGELDNANVITEQEIIQNTVEEQTTEIYSKDEIEDTEEESETNIEETGYVVIDNPSFEYYFEQGKENTSSSHIVTLKEELKEKNEITDEDKWLTHFSLVKPEFPYNDDKYQYEVYGDNAYDTYLLTLTDLQTGKELVTLDFSNYRYGTEYVKEDYDFISQRIIYAQERDGVLYVATGHNTYSASCAQTAYITAIDLSDYHVIWKTEPLTCNSYSFAIVDDFIICGYGFTSEKDSLNVVDRNNGTVQSSISVKSMPEYIIYQNGKLYVRTYNTNYVYTVAISD